MQQPINSQLNLIISKPQLLLHVVYNIQKFLPLQLISYFPQWILSKKIFKLIFSFLIEPFKRVFYFFIKIFIDLKKGAVLVHCGAGISRSATLVIAYYMRKYKSPFKQAITQIRKIKSNVCPNLGFQLQLKNYQDQLNIAQVNINKQNKSTTLNNRNHNHKKSEHRNQPTSSSYLFQMPLQTQHHFEIKNKSRTHNRTFNKTHTGKINHQKDQNSSNLFIKGTNALQKKSLQVQKQFNFYEPNKYSRKYATKQKYMNLSQKKAQIKGGFKF